MFYCHSKFTETQRCIVTLKNAGSVYGKAFVHCQNISWISVHPHKHTSNVEVLLFLDQELSLCIVTIINPQQNSSQFCSRSQKHTIIIIKPVKTTTHSAMCGFTRPRIWNLSILHIIKLHIWPYSDKLQQQHSYNINKTEFLIKCTHTEDYKIVLGN